MSHLFISSQEHFENKIKQTAVPPSWFHLFMKTKPQNFNRHWCMRRPCGTSMQSISRCPQRLCLSESRMESWVFLQWDESCVEMPSRHLCQCLHSQSDFMGHVKKYGRLIYKQRLPLKLGRQVGSKHLYVWLTQDMLFKSIFFSFSGNIQDFWYTKAIHVEFI